MPFCIPAFPVVEPPDVIPFEVDASSGEFANHLSHQHIGGWHSAEAGMADPLPYAKAEG